MRKLASIQEIAELRPIENADNIECAVILGWTVVVKKGEFKVGDKCVFHEIDSIVPAIDTYAFLGDARQEYQGHRVKTVRLRGQLSQGLALPLEAFDLDKDLEVGTDLTEVLHIRKYEPPVPEEEGAKPSSRVWEIPKTDEERYQSNPRLVKELQGKPFYGSVKLDGTSTTVILNYDDEDRPEVNVCGRNSCYIESPNNKYWAVAMKYQMKEKILEYYERTGMRLAFQGELIGPKIQGNKMGLTENDLYIFNVWKANGKQLYEKCPLDEALDIVCQLGFKFVPIVYQNECFNYETEELQGLTNIKYKEYFEGAKPSQNIEGIVFRSIDMKTSFKVISNEFLLKTGE